MYACVCVCMSVLRSCVWQYAPPFSSSILSLSLPLSFSPPPSSPCILPPSSSSSPSRLRVPAPLFLARFLNIRAGNFALAGLGLGLGGWLENLKFIYIYIKEEKYTHTSYIQFTAQHENTHIYVPNNNKIRKYTRFDKIHLALREVGLDYRSGHYLVDSSQSQLARISRIWGTFRTFYRVSMR